MEWALFLIVAVLVGIGGAVALLTIVAAALGLSLESRIRTQRLQQLAGALEMTVRDDHLAGTIGEHAATIAPRTIEGTDGASYDGWVVRIGGLPRDLALRTGGRTKGQPRTGDPNLDRKWTVAAQPGAVGRLSAPARHELERLRRLCERVVLEGGRLEIQTRSESSVQRLIPAMRVVVTSLGEGGVGTELAERVKNDPLASVRATMLWHLAKIDRQRALRLARTRRAQSAEELMIAGTLLDDLERIAAVMEYPTVSLSLATSACDRWLRHGGDPSRALDAMERQHQLEGLLAAAKLLVERPDAVRPMIERMPRVLTKAGVDLHQARPVLVAFARTFGAVGDRECEPSLLAMLEVADNGVRRVAVQSLQVCGTVAAVSPLRQLQDQVSALSGLRAPIQQTIDSIQGRSSGVAGALAVVEVAGDRGGLALAHDEEEGKLALADAERAQRAHSNKVGSS